MGGVRMQGKIPILSFCVVSSLLLELVQESRRKSQSEKERGRENRKHCLVAGAGGCKSGPKSYPALSKLHFCLVDRAGWPAYRSN